MIEPRFRSGTVQAANPGDHTQGQGRQHHDDIGRVGSVYAGLAQLFRLLRNARGAGEQRASGEKKYYLANLPAATDLRTLAATIKARWICEQAHQQLKEELGLDHFEGRSWQGLHRHALMTMIAYAFLQHRRLAYAGRKKKNQRASASANDARRTSRHRRSHPSAAV